MSYILRTFECTDCGATTTRKRHPADARICVECGTRRAAEAARAMVEMKGPAYDKWAAKIRKRLDRPSV